LKAARARSKGVTVCEVYKHFCQYLQTASLAGLRDFVNVVSLAFAKNTGCQIVIMIPLYSKAGETLASLK